MLASCGGGDGTGEPLPSTSTVGLEAPAEESTTTSVVTTTSTLPPPPLVADLLFVPEPFRERLVELVEETQRLRGLSFSDPLSIEAITSQEMTRRLRAQVEDNPDVAQLNQTLFKLLGLVDSDSDWVRLLAEFHARPTPGFYDVLSRNLWLISTLEAPTPLEEVTLVGEIAKALVDQHLGIWERRYRLSRSGQSDSLTVLGAMAEADSTLIELLFAEGMTPENKRQMVEEAWALSAGEPALPAFVQSSLQFSSGPALDYLQRLYQSGGWESVNNGHRRPPPVHRADPDVGIGSTGTRPPAPTRSLSSRRIPGGDGFGLGPVGMEPPFWRRLSIPSRRLPPPGVGAGTVTFSSAPAGKWRWWWITWETPSPTLKR